MIDPTRPKKILIVDDSEIVLAVTRDALQNAGYEVLTHPRPTGCIALILQTSPDLLLIDVNMPGLNGDTVVKMFGATQPNSQTLVLLHSSLPAHVLQQKAAASGAHGFIQKTESPQELVRQVFRWLRPSLGSGTHALLTALTSRNTEGASSSSGTRRNSLTPKKSGNILLVDHEMMRLSEYRRYVQSQPGAVEFALSGTEVLRRLTSSTPPDVVVLGRLLGQPSRREVYEDAVELNLGWAQRFILIRDGEQDIDSSPHTKVLRPPVTERSLCQAVQECLGHSPARSTRASG